MNYRKWHFSYLASVSFCVFSVTNTPTLSAAPPAPQRQPVARVVDLSVGETASVRLADGKTAQVKLVEAGERRDPLRNAVREARATVEVNGQPITLGSGNYHLPQTIAGVQIDCPITRAYTANSNRNLWGLDKDARVRLWPAGSPLMEPGTFVYPLKQRWFATGTQMGNEPTHVDGGDRPENKTVYYHNDLDFGGCEALVQVVAATDGLVVSAAGQTAPGYENTPAHARYDVVYVLDDRGWYYRYSHLFEIDKVIQAGAKVKMGQRIGLLGKEGSSGGWSHLHFGIVSKQPSGKWGTEEAYAFAWEAYQREYQPKLIAVARPHQLVAVGQKVTVDGSKSWSTRKIASNEWELSDGTRAKGLTAERTYTKPGMYSEVLRIEDDRGNVAYDFAVVQVIDPACPGQLPPTIHASYAPTFGIKPGAKVTFKVRTFRTTGGTETWDFGDGSPRLTVKSDGTAKSSAKDGYAVTEHAFKAPGVYVVRASRTNGRDETATTCLAVTVEK